MLPSRRCSDEFRCSSIMVNNSVFHTAESGLSFNGFFRKPEKKYPEYPVDPVDPEYPVDPVRTLLPLIYLFCNFHSVYEGFDDNTLQIK